LLLSQTGKSSEADVEYRLALALRQELADDSPSDNRILNNGRHEETLDPLREREDFKKLLAELEKPSLNRPEK
jgi:hypothetical protein